MTYEQKWLLVVAALMISGQSFGGVIGFILIAACLPIVVHLLLKRVLVQIGSYKFGRRDLDKPERIR